MAHDDLASSIGTDPQEVLAACGTDGELSGGDISLRHGGLSEFEMIVKLL